MKKITIFILSLVFIAAVSGCSTDYKKKPQPVHIENMIMAESEHENYTVKLVLAEGEYFDINHAVPGGGTYDENYSGQYFLRVYEGKKLLSESDLGERNIGEKFEIEFSDYNGDGNIDFTIGAWAGSNFNEYTIFTIGENAKIDTLGLILSSEFKYEKDFSALFSHENGVISTMVYDIDKAESVTVSYEWNENENKFIQKK